MGNSYVAGRYLRDLAFRETLSVDEVTELFLRCRFADQIEIDLANKIFPQSGIYLKAFEIDQLIRADLSDAEAGRLIAERKIIFKKICFILPSILNLFDFDAEKNYNGFVEHLEDTILDYRLSKDKPRRDKSRRNALEALSQIGLQSAKLADLIKENNFNLSLYDQKYQIWKEGIRSVDLLSEDLRFLQITTEIQIALTSIDEDVLYLRSPPVKSDLVEAAHYMSESWSGPKLVTTPGSNFSLLCSLLFECSGGCAEDSMAGAVNRYARSKKRREFDNYNRLRKIEEDAINAGFEDNFLGLQERIDFHKDEVRKYGKLLNNSALSDKGKLMVVKIIEEALNAIEAEQSRYGPNLVWAHRISNATTEIYHKEMNETTERLRALKIELGNLRRQAHSA